MKLFSKIATAIVGIAMAVGVGTALTISPNVKDANAGTANFTLSSASDVTVEGVTVSFAKGSGSNAPAWYDAGLRLYISNTVTISSADTITSISFNWEKQGKKDFASVTADVGSYTHPASPGVGTWTGSENAIVFTLSGNGQLQLNTFSVDFSGGSTTSYTVTDDITNGTIDKSSVNEGATLVTTITPDSGYKLPDSVSVTMGGTSVTHTYVDGVVTVANVTNDIVISGECPEADPYFVLDATSFELTSTYSEGTATFENVDYAYKNAKSQNLGSSPKNNFNSNATILLDGANGGYFYNTSAIGTKISKLEVYSNIGSSTNVGNKIAIDFSDKPLTSAKETPDYEEALTTADHVYSYTPTGSNPYFRIGTTGTKNPQIQIRISYEKGLDSAIENSLHQEGPFTLYEGGSAMTFMFYDASGEYHERVYDDLDWSISDNTVLNLVKNTSECSVSGLTPGSATLSCVAPGYKTATVTINVEENPDIEQLTIYGYDGSKATNPADDTTILYSKTAELYRYVAVDEDGEIVTTANWTSLATDVATVSVNAGVASITTLKPGGFSLSASATNYKTGSASITVDKSYLEELSVGGAMSVTTYTTKDSWNPTGLTVTATYHSGWTEDVTSDVIWSYDPTDPAENVTSVIATANYEEQSANSLPQAVSVSVAHDGTLEDPYTVEEAYQHIDSQEGVEDVYVIGIVSKIVEEYSTKFQNISFNISTDGELGSKQLQAYRCVTSEAHPIASNDDVEIGATVIVYGNLTKYKETYEFSAGCTIESYTPPESGEIDVTFNPPANLEIHDAGTLVATTDAANPVFTWSVDQDSLFDLDTSTGEYEVTGLGEVKVTVNVTSDDGEGFASAYIKLNGSISSPYTVKQANDIAASLPSSEATPYYIYVKAYVKEFATSKDQSGNPRGLDITTLDESSKILIYTNVSPYEAFVDGLSLGDYLIVKANVKNYSGTYELTSPERMSYAYSSMTFAFDLLDQTDTVCKDYDDVTDNKEAIEAVWEKLSGESYYGRLTDADKTDLVNAKAKEDGTTIEQAMARYDYLVNKYKVDNFITGRKTNESHISPVIVNNVGDSTMSIIIVSVIALSSISAIAVLLIIKRRKTY